MGIGNPGVLGRIRTPSSVARTPASVGPLSVGRSRAATRSSSIPEYLDVELYQKFIPEPLDPVPGIWSALCMGIAQALGSITLVLAMDAAPSSAMVPIVIITGMYGAVTTLL